jgi:hypothetical protein
MSVTVDFRNPKTQCVTAGLVAGGVLYAASLTVAGALALKVTAVALLAFGVAAVAAGSFAPITHRISEMLGLKSNGEQSEESRILIGVAILVGAAFAIAFPLIGYLIQRQVDLDWWNRWH